MIDLHLFSAAKNAGPVLVEQTCYISVLSVTCQSSCLGHMGACPVLDSMRLKVNLTSFKLYMVTFSSLKSKMLCSEDA